MNIYKVRMHNSSVDFIRAVEANTPEEAIKKYIKYYNLPQDGFQRQGLGVEFISNDLIK